MPIRDTLNTIATNLRKAVYAGVSEFPAVPEKEMDELTEQIFTIAKDVHSGDPQRALRARALWDIVNAKITEEAAEKLALPMAMLLWRYRLAEIAELNTSELHRPFNVAQLHKPIPEEEQDLLNTDDVERATSALPDEAPDPTHPPSYHRLRHIFLKNFPGERLNQETDGKWMRRLKQFLNALVKTCAIPASLGAGLTLAGVPQSLGYKKIILSWVLMAWGMLQFSSIYFGAKVELLDFNSCEKAFWSSVCTVGALVFSAPSAELNYEGVDTNIANIPLELTGSVAEGTSYGSAAANYSANVLLGLGQLLQLVILFSVYKAHFLHMPNKTTKAIFLFRKACSWFICLLSMYCYLQAGRKIPTISNVPLSYTVSVIKNITDLATLFLASARLPWLGVFSSPLSLRAQLYEGVTGATISVILAKYTYDDISKDPELFDDWISQLLLLILVFTANFHFYAPFGKYTKWLIEDVFGHSMKYLYTGMKAICRKDTSI